MRPPCYLLAVALLGAACGGDATQPATVTQIGFTAQPVEARQSTAFPAAVQVALQTSTGATVASATDAVTLALATNPNGATLLGTTTVNAVAGVATFSGLSLNKHANGYTLAAASGSLTSVSTPFASRLDMLFGRSVEDAASSNHSPSYLLGSAITVTEPVTLTHLSVIGKVAGSQVKLALYTDVGGDPSALVVATPATAVPVGRLEIAVAATPLAAGTYWIMANYNVAASIGYDQSDAAAVVKYISLPFATDPPATFGTPTTYNGQRFNYYMNVLAP